MRTSYGDQPHGAQWAGWARRVIERWIAWDEEGRDRLLPRVFFRTGDLILREAANRYFTETRRLWDAHATPYEVLGPDEVEHRWPWIRYHNLGIALSTSRAQAWSGRGAPSSPSPASSRRREARFASSGRHLGRATDGRSVPCSSNRAAPFGGDVRSRLRPVVPEGPARAHGPSDSHRHGPRLLLRRAPRRHPLLLSAHAQLRRPGLHRLAGPAPRPPRIPRPHRRPASRRSRPLRSLDRAQAPRSRARHPAAPLSRPGRGAHQRDPRLPLREQRRQQLHHRHPPGPRQRLVGRRRLRGGLHRGGGVREAARDTRRARALQGLLRLARGDPHVPRPRPRGAFLAGRRARGRRLAAGTGLPGIRVSGLRLQERAPGARAPTSIGPEAGGRAESRAGGVRPVQRVLPEHRPGGPCGAVFGRAADWAAPLPEALGPGSRWRSVCPSPGTRARRAGAGVRRAWPSRPPCAR